MEIIKSIKTINYKILKPSTSCKKYLSMRALGVPRNHPWEIPLPAPKATLGAPLEARLGANLGPT